MLKFCSRVSLSVLCEDWVSYLVLACAFICVWGGFGFGILTAHRRLNLTRMLCIFVLLFVCLYVYYFRAFMRISVFCVNVHEQINTFLKAYTCIYIKWQFE